jgi:hypothetical protein
MAHGDAREGKWRGNWRMEWVASTLHTTSERGVSSITTITTADAHTSPASNRQNWCPRRFKWTRPFRRKTKSGFCACAITFQTQSTCIPLYCTQVPDDDVVEVPTCRKDIRNKRLCITGCAVCWIKYCTRFQPFTQHIWQQFLSILKPHAQTQFSPYVPVIFSSSRGSGSVATPSF